MRLGSLNLTRICSSGVRSKLHVRGPFYGSKRREKSLGCAYDAPKSVCRGGSLVRFSTTLLMLLVSVSENEIVCYNVGNAASN